MMIHRALLSSSIVLLVSISVACVDDKPPSRSSGDASSNAEVFEDCRDEDRACSPPFMCRTTPGGDMGCSSSPDDVPACRPFPDTLSVPVQTDGDNLIRWTSGDGCVTVSYDAPELSAGLEVALADWNGIACDPLCLDGPIQRDDPPNLERAERRIHFSLNETGVDTVLSLTQTNYENATGRIINVTVLIDPESDIPQQPYQLMRSLAQATGLTTPQNGTPSLLAPGLSEDSGLTTFTEADEETICALYGADPLCGD